MPTAATAITGRRPRLQANGDAGLSAPSRRILWRGSHLRLGSFDARPDRGKLVTIFSTGPWPEIILPRAPVLIHPEGNAPFVADSTLMILSNPYQSFGSEALGGEGDRCEWLAVDPALISEISAAASRPYAVGERPFTTSHAPLDGRAYMLVQLVARHAAGGRLEPLWIEETLIRVLIACLGPHGRFRGAPDHASRRRQWVNEAKAVCAARLGQDLSVADIAACLGLSRYYLSRIFLAETGYRLCDYIVELRLRASLERLADRTEAVAPIALGLGFSSHGHFTKVFHERFGVTPSQFRSAHRQVVQRVLHVAL